MKNDPPEIKNNLTVRVVPFQDGWTVQWDAGHYACPIAKSEAITKASRIAMESGRSQIAIMTVEGALERLLPLAGQRL